MKNLIDCLNKITSTINPTEILGFKAELQSNILPKISFMSDKFADDEIKKLLISDIDDYISCPDESNKQKILSQLFFLTNV